MWLYQNKEVKSLEDIPEGTFGFIYQITYLPTQEKYIGKKQLMSNRTLPPLKGQKRKRKIVKEGDWKTYFSSHSLLKEYKKKEGEQNFKREILKFVPTKKLLTYYELKYQMVEGVIEPDSGYLNDNLTGKYYRKDFYT